MKKKNIGKSILTVILVIAAVAAGVFAFQYYEKIKALWPIKNLTNYKLL